jgi:ABC-type cobalamin/Fe3+-siderophores transport system ATPase subunit
MMPFDAALRTRDLAVGYRTRRARRAVLEHVNLAVDSGELVCLLGPNGIGKSTLLRTIARMQPPLWGSVELGGADLRAVSHAELARRLGVVLTERVAVEALTVRQIVGLGRYPHSGAGSAALPTAIAPPSDGRSMRSACAISPSVISAAYPTANASA